MARTIGLGVKTSKKDNSSAKLKDKLRKAESDLADAKSREAALLKQNETLSAELQKLNKDSPEA